MFYFLCQKRVYISSNNLLYTTNTRYRLIKRAYILRGNVFINIFSNRGN